MTSQKQRRSTSRAQTALQILAGLPLGLITAWGLLQALPLRSGVAVCIVSATITLAAACVVGARFRAARPGAYSFAVSATVLNALVAVVVAL
ncbi:hypothetical protein [Rhodococcus sp. 24CO]|uniref:hypothetical protein n=1 Tax=Rhodococcus sp. 24CO TaxID=3117460 RepID=UPI003D34AB9E